MGPSAELKFRCVDFRWQHAACILIAGGTWCFLQSQISYPCEDFASHVLFDVVLTCFMFRLGIELLLNPERCILLGHIRG